MVLDKEELKGSWLVCTNKIRAWRDKQTSRAEMKVKNNLWRFFHKTFRRFKCVVVLNKILKLDETVWNTKYTKINHCLSSYFSKVCNFWICIHTYHMMRIFVVCEWGWMILPWTDDIKCHDSRYRRNFWIPHYQCQYCRNRKVFDSKMLKLS